MSIWIVYKDGEQIDATPEQVSLWLQEGVINKYTQVFLEGNTDWVGYGRWPAATGPEKSAERAMKTSATTRTSRMEADAKIPASSGSASSIGAVEDRTAATSTTSILKASSASSSRSNSGSALTGYGSDFIDFRKILTPVIIKVLFWFAVAGFLLTGQTTMLGAFGLRGASAGLVFPFGLAWVVLGPVAARIFCEMPSWSESDELEFVG